MFSTKTQVAVLEWRSIIYKIIAFRLPMMKTAVLFRLPRSTTSIRLWAAELWEWPMHLMQL